RTLVLAGMVMCISAAIIELIAARALGPMRHAWGDFVESFVVVAPIEESLKLFVVVVYLWPGAEFDGVMDGIRGTGAASLGFAVAENVIYSSHDVVVGIIRMFTTIPMHAIVSGIMGYFVGRARLARGAESVSLLTGLCSAILIHGAFDWIVLSVGGFGFAQPNPHVAVVLLALFIG